MSSFRASRAFPLSMAIFSWSVLQTGASPKVYALETKQIRTSSTPSCDGGNHCTQRKPPSKVTDNSRSDSYNDFLRIIWVPHGITVNTITRGLRGFFSASTFFKPPVTVDDYLRFSGNFYREGQDFVEMRCQPSPEQRQAVLPFLAAWPNTFHAIAADLGGPNHDCTSPSLTPGEKQICELAIHYQDPTDTIYDNGLASTLIRGAQMFATPESRDALSKDYGIFTAHTGLGFTVQLSAAPVSGAIVPMTTAEVLRNSIIPEYLLKNANLANAGCRCLQVPEKESLHTSPVSPVEIWRRGELVDGACRRVDHLGDDDHTPPNPLP